jgi:NACHT domain
MTGNRNRTRRGLLLVLVLVAWAITVAAVSVALLIPGATDVTTWATVVGTTTAIAGVVAPLAEKGMSRALPPSPAAVKGQQVRAIDQAAEDLAEAVQLQWLDEARTRRLQDPWPLPVQWARADRSLSDQNAVDTGLPTVIASIEGTLTDTGSRLAEFYEGLRYRRLVVLGEPGSGKSVLAIMLLLALMRHRKRGTRVPILLSVAAWDPSRVAFTDWISDSIVAGYGLGMANARDNVVIANGLVTGNRLIPILDGLDEMPGPLRSRGILEINRSLDLHQPLILTCRREEYREVVESADVLTFSSAIELQPLTAQAVIDYFRATTPPGPRTQRWDPVFQRIATQPDDPVSNVLHAPLMVSLARIAYGDNPTDPSALLENDLRTDLALELHLIDGLIPAVYPDVPARAGTRRRQRWHPGDVARWLSFIARHLDRTGSQDFYWWELERAVPPLLITAVRLAPAVLIVWLILGQSVAAVFLVVVVTLHLTIGYRASTVEEWLRDGPLRRLRQRRPPVQPPALPSFGDPLPRIPAEKRIALAVGRLSGVLAGCYVALKAEAATSYPKVAHGVSVGLAVGLAAGFILVSARASPTKVQFRARRGLAFFARQLLMGIMIGTGVGLVAGALTGWRFGLTIGLAIGLAIGLVDGLNVWLDVSADVTRALSPQSTLDADRAATLARGAIIGITIGICSGVAVGLANGPVGGIAYGCAFGLAFTLSDPYDGITSTAWGRYSIARNWLALSGRLPWRLNAFLDDAHHHGLLRQVGPAYRFRHSRLQERLAQAIA